ncbi:glycosyltransferase [Alicyclobacillus sp. SO9]|nr:glycosyltransferase [Alicyclobacillus sp. SO9]
MHTPIEIAGQMGILCQGLRSVGWRANGYNWFQTYLNYESPIVETDAYELQHVFDQVVHAADIIHFHNGDTMLADYKDLQIAKALNKKMVMHHWGNDVRDVERLNQRLKYPLPLGYHSTQQIQDKLQKLSAYIDTAIIQDNELYEFIKPYYKNVYILPLALNTSDLAPAYPDMTKQKPLLVHAPTNDEFKGTKYVEAAIAALQTRHQFDYQRIEKMDHKTAMSWYSKADVVIDQLLCGTYGLLSVEAMAMGKPVVTYIREELKPTYPGQLPIVSASPDTLESTLEDLILHPKKRRILGQQGRHYVEKYHDVRVVTKQLIAIYKQVYADG